MITTSSNATTRELEEGVRIPLNPNRPLLTQIRHGGRDWKKICKGVGGVVFTITSFSLAIIEQSNCENASSDMNDHECTNVGLLISIIVTGCVGGCLIASYCLHGDSGRHLGIE